MRVEFGTFRRSRPPETAENLTKVGVSERRDGRKPLIKLDKPVYILLGWCTYPF